MTLKDCTKDELIFIINNFKKYAFSQGDYYLSQCLHDVEHRRFLKRQEEADRQAVISHQSRQAYFEFLKKYEGTKLSEIPPEEFERAKGLLDAAEKADQKYMRLINNVK